MAGHEQVGRTFLEELAGKLPENLRGDFTRIITAAEAQAALDHVGSRVQPIDAARTDLNQRMTALNAAEARLTDWSTRLGKWKTDAEAEQDAREEKLTAREAALNTGGGGGRRAPDLPNQPAPADVAKVVEDTVKGVLRDREAIYVDTIAETNRLSAFHMKTFGEVLDTRTLMNDPQAGEIGLEGVYRKLHHTKLETLATQQKTAEREAIKKEVRDELFAERPAELPYPVGEGSPLDALSRPAAERPKGDVAAATRMYEQLVAGRT